MIRYLKGNLFMADAEALVNPVNEVGVSGKGLALQFKKAHPENFKLYATACRAQHVRVGQMFTTSVVGCRCDWIVNFPTKKHWRDPSQPAWIVAGLLDLRNVIQARLIRSIAIPALGCGLGGLPWPEVSNMIAIALDGLDCDIQVFPPRD